MGGRQILSTGSLREMHRVRMLENNWTQGNAIGFAVDASATRSTSSHGGSYPGYQTNTMLQLDGKVGVIVLTNADDSTPAVIATQLMKTVGEAVAKASAPTPAKTSTGIRPGRASPACIVAAAAIRRSWSSTSGWSSFRRMRPISITRSGSSRSGNGQFRYVAPVAEARSARSCDSSRKADVSSA